MALHIYSYTDESLLFLEIMTESFPTTWKIYKLSHNISFLFCRAALPQFTVLIACLLSTSNQTSTEATEPFFLFPVSSQRSFINTILVKNIGLEGTFVAHPSHALRHWWLCHTDFRFYQLLAGRNPKINCLCVAQNRKSLLRWWGRLQIAVSARIIGINKTTSTCLWYQYNSRCNSIW